MSEYLEKHPSNITKSALEFLSELDVSAKSKRQYEELIELFIHSLCGDPSAVVETSDGEYVLKHNWDAYWGGAFSVFVESWMPRKVMGADTLHAKAPAMLRKWAEWLHEKGYLNEEKYEDFLESVPVGKGEEVKRLNKASRLFYELRADAWAEDPDEQLEGDMVLKRIDGVNGYFEDEEGINFGPLKLGKPLVSILRTGDRINLLVGKTDKGWEILESGMVYAEGSI